MKKFLVNVLRWLLVLPASIVSMIFAYFVLSFFTVIPIPIWSYIAEFIAGQGAAAAFVLTGSCVAPRFRKETAWVLFSLFLIYSVYAVIDPYGIYKDYGIIESVVYKIGGILGASAGVFWLYKEEY